LDDWLRAHCGEQNAFDLWALVFALILAGPSPKRSGLLPGDFVKHWWKVLIVCAVPILLTALVYPRLAVRPFAGAAVSMWLISPLAQDLVFVGYLYGRFAERFPEPFRFPLNVPLIVTALFFCLWHVPNFFGMPAGYVVFQLSYVFVGTLWMGMTRVWTGSMLYITVVHMAVNFIAWKAS
jgi:membrane protease YdiL (CAAX protease family)